MADSPATLTPPPAKAKPPKKAAKTDKPKPAVKPKPTNGTLPPFHVVLLDDDHHTYEYVVEMLKSVFGHPVEKGFKLAQEVDLNGRVIVLTTHKELAELKRDQIHAYGVDKRIATCKGSMSAKVERAN